MLAALIGAGLWSMASSAIAAAPDAAPPMTPVAGCDLHPIRATHTVPPYPELSRRMYEQGNAVVIVTIDAQGIPTAVSVDKPSGFARLDDAARDWVRDTWRWEPLAASCPKSLRTLVKIDFSLSESTPATPPSLTIDVPDAELPSSVRDGKESGSAIIIVIVDATGAIVDARIGSTTTFNDLDERAVYLAKRHAFQAPMIDGKPVPGMFWIVVKFAATSK
jgi:TonB family protein